ncbi:hypothetical protein HMI55_001260, partial [Coelomomyces lativittatus]
YILNTKTNKSEPKIFNSSEIENKNRKELIYFISILKKKGIHFEIDQVFRNTTPLEDKNTSVLSFSLGNAFGVKLKTKLKVHNISSTGFIL